VATAQLGSLHWLRSPGAASLSRDVATGSSAESFCNTPPWVSCSSSLLLWRSLVRRQGRLCNTCGVTTWY
jgi:hypothetical protein